jgi:hypothetical protein
MDIASDYRFPEHLRSNVDLLQPICLHMVDRSRPFCQASGWVEPATMGVPAPAEGLLKELPPDIRRVDRWPALTACPICSGIDVDLSLPDFWKLADMSTAPKAMTWLSSPPVTAASVGSLLRL